MGKNSKLCEVRTVFSDTGDLIILRCHNGVIDRIMIKGPNKQIGKIQIMLEKLWKKHTK